MAFGVVLVRALVDEEVVALPEHPLAVATHEGVLGARLPTLTQHLGLAILPVSLGHLDGVLLREEREEDSFSIRFSSLRSTVCDNLFSRSSLHK